MTDAPHPSAPRPRRHELLTWVLAVFLLLNVLAVGYQVQALGTAQGQLHKLQQAVRLYELERVPPPGYTEAFGYKALLNHLLYWGPKIQVADAATGDKAIVREKVRGIADAMAALGPDIYPFIEETYLKGGVLTKDPATNDEVRNWLLLAARGADNARGTELIVDTLRDKLIRDKKFPVSQRLRLMAAKMLCAGRDEDKRLAGEVLHEILTTDRSGNTDLFNFVIEYQGTGHAKTEETMLMLLGRREHNRMTVQKAIQYLGQIKSDEAIEPVKKLFLNPPWRTGDNAYFRAICLNVLDEIMGSDIVPFLEEVDRKEDSAFVRNRINDLRKKYPKYGK